jgi:hypothetical protein
MFANDGKFETSNLNWLLSLGVTAAVLLAGANALWAQKRSPAAKFELTASSFTSGGNIPRQFTCEGENISPALAWTEPPPGTQSLALIVDDPDAPMGTFVHWVVYDLPTAARQLPDRIPRKDDLPGGGVQGRNDFARTGYGGPCPPPGKPHRYFFKLYALDSKLNLPAGIQKRDVEQAIRGHVLAEAHLMGRYGR